MACNFQTSALPCVTKVLPSLQPETNLNTNLNYRSKSYTKTLTTVSREKITSVEKFGSFGGKFVAEVLIAPLAELETKFNSILHDHEFQMELDTAMRDYVGRETPLYQAQKLTDHYKNINGEGPEIYLKREDLCHGGSYKMNNVVAQAILAKHMGRKHIITASVGNHGVAAASVCAKFSLDCIVFIGTEDMKRNPSNVKLMKLLGAQVKPVDGSFQAAVSESTREWIGNLESSYYLAGTAVGPHPIPTMVREFNSLIGKETRKQALERWGGKPDVLIACVGTGCNALGLFHEFVGDKSVRMIGVEGGGVGIKDDELHSASLVKGEIGVYHGAMCYLIQDKEGQIPRTQSVASGLGAQVKPVDGSFQAAVSESTREWIGNLESSYYLAGTAVGPHPIPTMVREFNSLIGKETRKQALERWGGKPDVLIACVGTGCNALGLFHEFVGDKSVRMIGVEGGGVGIKDDELHSASLVKGEIGVYHGAMCYLIQDKEGQIPRTQSVASGLKFPGVSPELSFLKDAGRVECYTVTDQEALNAYKKLCLLEGIFPALEASHALAYLEKLCPTLPNGAKVVVNCSGTGYNDATIVLDQ